ncbi:MAG: PEGA domain-containing protein [Planctomycetes bacterium]|nr:PEGA domain-containing protein [Planctomycetota bacterium]MCB9918083.1 PEGA domain-containing protein [Planctomycetota bacterium]
MRHTKKLALLLSACLALPSCLWIEGDARVFVTSDPAGADILIDGRDTGLTTPAKVDLDGFFGDDHTIQVQKIGFEPEERIVTHYRAWNTSKWNDGAADWSTFAFPLFWTFGDFIFPFEVKYAYVPHQLHVKLYEQGTFRRGDATDSIR